MNRNSKQGTIKIILREKLKYAKLAKPTNKNWNSMMEKQPKVPNPQTKLTYSLFKFNNCINLMTKIPSTTSLMESYIVIINQTYTISKAQTI